VTDVVRVQVLDCAEEIVRQPQGHFDGQGIGREKVDEVAVLAELGDEDDGARCVEDVNGLQNVGMKEETGKDSFVEESAAGVAGISRSEFCTEWFADSVAITDTDGSEIASGDDVAYKVGMDSKEVTVHEKLFTVYLDIGMCVRMYGITLGIRICDEWFGKRTKLEVGYM
jgi:hypothetical protein